MVYSSVTTAPGQVLRTDAAIAWDALAHEVRRRYGWTPALTDSLRSYEVQERIFLERYTTTYLPGRPVKIWKGRAYFLKPGQATAAVPGTSNHGKGLAVDVTALGGFNGTRFKQLAAVAPAYGWTNTEGRAIGEAWHWGYTGTYTPPAPARPSPPVSTVQEDEDMPTANEIAAALLNTPHPEFQNRTLAQQLAQIINNDAANRTHLQSIIQSIPAATLAHVVPRAGMGAGETNLGAVVAYTDDHMIRIMTKLAEMS